jgi:hypothetical protein
MNLIIILCVPLAIMIPVTIYALVSMKKDKKEGRPEAIA